MFCWPTTELSKLLTSEWLRKCITKATTKGKRLIYTLIANEEIITMNLSMAGIDARQVDGH
jgi:hypothetical protein